MRVLISLSVGTKQFVLDKIVATINSTSSGSGAANLKSGVYTNESCYGAVAHYLRTHWQDSWQILMYGESYVVHCCLYSHDGKKIIDTFSGVPGPVYRVDDEDLPLLAAVPLHSIKSAIDRFKS